MKQENDELQNTLLLRESRIAELQGEIDHLNSADMNKLREMEEMEKGSTAHEFVGKSNRERECI